MSILQFKEFGDRHNKKALLIHGGYVTWRTLQIQIELLAKEYYVIVPLLNGHNLNDNSQLLSIEQEAEQIIKYLNNKNISKVEILYGASLGADIALEILSQSYDLVKYAVIESGSLGINRVTAYFLTKATVKTMYYGVRGKRFYGLILNRFLANLKMPKELYKNTKDLLSHMTKLTLNNVQSLVCNYSLKDNIKYTTAKILVIYSTKEKYLVKPYNDMKKLVANMKILCLQNYSHGELCIGNPNKVVQIIKRFVESI